ncbi:metal-dependent hydrolase [Desulfosporosinus youngiae]|uniref:Putative membrane-bound metal-dependent hydrolase n=1 Tax=Desulfosporosinus youngiae DSM 17734 TaxID=768710 RepID=H5XVJ3_9FIRM|nr:metal-dependent hydrolase [Desulfosporosinus youngiae]EHQ90076.1 putative membrane-bound metal-dependent hydrolase [Desulfosporosinus youngiae DSM 17734]
MLDPITHGLIGIALSTLSGHTMQLNDPVFLGCTLGAMLPDLDIIFHVKGRLNYLLNHRGASHSLIALTASALGLGSALYLIFPTASWWSVILWTLIGTMSHGIMDLLNSYGAELLWPFSRKKITVDMIMLTDPVVFGSLLVSFMIALIKPELANISSQTALLLSALYLAYRHLGRIKTRDRLMDIYHLNDEEQVRVIPAMYHPFTWNFILFEEDYVRFGIIRDQEPSICRVLPKFKGDNPSVANALAGNLAEIFSQFTPYCHIIAHASETDECIVEFLDLRYWAKGNFLYTGNVYLNLDGEISQEIFHALPNQKGVLLSY